MSTSASSRAAMTISSIAAARCNAVRVRIQDRNIVQKFHQLVCAAHTAGAACPAATSAVQNGRLASLIFRNRERMIPSPLFVYVFPDQPHSRQQYGSQNRRNDPLNF